MCSVIYLFIYLIWKDPAKDRQSESILEYIENFCEVRRK